MGKHKFSYFNKCCAERSSSSLARFSSSSCKKILVPLDEDPGFHHVPLCSSAPHSVGLPLFPLSKREAPVTGLWNRDGSNTEEIYCPEECSDSFPCCCCLKICITCYLLGRGVGMSLMITWNLYRVCFGISPLSERRQAAGGTGCLKRQMDLVRGMWWKVWTLGVADG